MPPRATRHHKAPKGWTRPPPPFWPPWSAPPDVRLRGMPRSTDTPRYRSEAGVRSVTGDLAIPPSRGRRRARSHHLPGGRSLLAAHGQRVARFTAQLTAARARAVGTVVEPPLLDWNHALPGLDLNGHHQSRIAPSPLAGQKPAPTTLSASRTDPCSRATARPEQGGPLCIPGCARAGASLGHGSRAFGARARVSGRRRWRRGRRPRRSCLGPAGCPT